MKAMTGFISDYNAKQSNLPLYRSVQGEIMQLLNIITFIFTRSVPSPGGHPCGLPPRSLPLVVSAEGADRVDDPIHESVLYDVYREHNRICFVVNSIDKLLAVLQPNSEIPDGDGSHVDTGVTRFGQFK